jgi:hypothetical protein
LDQEKHAEDAAPHYRIFGDGQASDDVAILTLRFAKRTEERAAIFERSSQMTAAAGTRTGHA